MSTSHPKKDALKSKSRHLKIFLNSFPFILAVMNLIYPKASRLYYFPKSGAKALRESINSVAL